MLNKTKKTKTTNIITWKYKEDPCGLIKEINSKISDGTSYFFTSIDEMLSRPDKPVWRLVYLTNGDRDEEYTSIGHFTDLPTLKSTIFAAQQIANQLAGRTAYGYKIALLALGIVFDTYLKEGDQGIKNCCRIGNLKELILQDTENES